jgi:hypothetical protein
MTNIFIMNKKNISINTSIDIKHHEMLERFNTIETTTIPNLILENNQLIEQIKLYKTKKDVDIYMELKDKILENKKIIKELKKEKNDYFVENSFYIFKYFEEKKKISSGDNNLNMNVLNTFFKIKSTNDDDDNINTDKYINSRITFQNYWKNINNEVINIKDFIVPSDICESCNKGELISQDEEGILICNNDSCAKFVTYIIDGSKPSNKEPPNEVSYTAYIRLNHFKEILAQFQAKETTQIPEEVIGQIKDRIKKERITDYSLINYDVMRDLLRKLGLNKYFEHIQYINSLFGIKPPVMNEELHETLCILFIEIQKPWAIHCPANRTNFFNYTYTLYQLCVLLDQTQYLPYIPMMKDREKQLEQDMIWKKVCKSLDWQFFPTV